MVPPDEPTHHEPVAHDLLPAYAVVAMGHPQRAATPVGVVEAGALRGVHND